MAYLDTILGNTTRQETDDERKIRTATLAQRQTLIHVGLDERSATEVLMNHSLYDLLEAEKQLDGFGFPLTEDGPGKISSIIGMLEVSPEYKNLLSTMARCPPIIGSCLPELVCAINAARGHHDKRSGYDEWYVFRDTILPASRKLLSAYGTPWDEADPAVRQSLFTLRDHDEARVLPASTESVVCEIMHATKAFKYSYDLEDAIKPGFATWDAALFFAKNAPGKERGVAAEAYRKLGLTTKEQLEAVPPGSILLDWHAFGAFPDVIAQYVKGDVAKCAELVCRSHQKSAKQYFEALNGNFADFDAVMALPARPSHEALTYAQKHFGPFNLDECVFRARAIDGAAEELFSVPTASVEEFFAIRTRHIRALERLAAAGVPHGRNFLPPLKLIEFIESYDTPGHTNPDLSLFRHFPLGERHLDEARLVGSYFSPGECERATEGFFSFDDSGIGKTIKTFAERGFSRDAIRTILLETPTYEKSQLQVLVKHIDPKSDPQAFVQALSLGGADREHALWFVEQGLIGENRETQLPFTLVPALRAHDIKPYMVKEFMAATDMTSYNASPGTRRSFAAIQFLRDLKEFHNLAQPAAEDRDGTGFRVGP